ncbi:cupin domain-containing protein [Nitriliruptor alkaliphilus]|uniref:cupin domain-containing protein n=1 Tax=Nitriliruptor alkaliphilus TaxID=427918 RepID=UPI0006961FE4|nr:cupin domain-containing protein [Nitriliruptor alkaliphilus]
MTTHPKDEGPEPFVLDIDEATLINGNFRTTLWTGTNLQLTVMAIAPGDDVGLEVHHDRDQFLRIEVGRGRVQMGPSEDDLPLDQAIEDDSAILVPAGTWHNVTNTGDRPLRLYALYAPPEHAHGTVHPTKADADADEHHH